MDTVTASTYNTAIWNKMVNIFVESGFAYKQNGVAYRLVKGKEIEITTETHLWKELDMDVTTFLGHISDFQKKFDTEIPDDIAGNFDTVGDALRYIEKNVPPVSE